ncbi:MAG: IPT/TIG domain-containing protein [Candidatus Pseudobacter hemicellulosilyticus]|uniref:IPT/TIG domain-containing protein n=1 Tax=Candidatus Pseudobacter hemicellulosilyticus TaxID=3121375 RepID=A0AAJ6BFZ9_9BACT|nr:MAG: IPT/TIG domain-containing protein [Pseudobacter sp.]
MTLLVLTACNRDDDAVAVIVIEPPVIHRVSNQTVQAGESLTVYGSGLSRAGMTTEVLISGRPAELLKQSADSLVIAVPATAYTGKLLVILSQGKAFASAELGGSLTIRPTAIISGFFPPFGYAGETIALAAQNFSEQAADNEIFLGTEKAEFVGKKNNDTVLVKIPENAATGNFSWRTYNGPLSMMPAGSVFGIRKQAYAVNTVAEWLSVDPGYTFLDTLVKGFPVLAGSKYEASKRVFDTAMNYLTAADRTYTVFLAGDVGYLSSELTRTKYIDNIKSSPSSFSPRLVAAIVPGQTIRMQALTGGESWNTAYTDFVYNPYGGDPDLANRIRIVMQDGQPYAQIYTEYGFPEGGPLKKLLRQFTIGNATLIEVDGDIGFNTSFY